MFFYKIVSIGAHSRELIPCCGLGLFGLPAGISPPYTLFV